MPRVKVEENTDEISIIGKGTLSVLINDRLIELTGEQLTSYLKSIRAEDVLKVEVITNPPAKYQAIGNSGILNIILKTARDNSLNGSLSTTYGYTTNEYVRYNGNLNFRKGKWTFTSSLRKYNGKWTRKVVTDIFYPESTWTIKDNPYRPNENVGGNIGIDYEINNLLITGFNLNANFGDGKREGDISTSIFDNNLQKNIYYIVAEDGSKFRWDYITFNYHVIKKFKKEGKKFTFDFDYFQNNYNRNNVFSSNEFNEFFNPIVGKEQVNKTNQDVKNNKFSFNFDMEQPINTWNLNYGARVDLGKSSAENDRFYKINTDFIEDTNFIKNYVYNEDVFALYYSVEKSFSEKWKAKAGLRYEKADLKGKLVIQDIIYKNHYDGLFPTAYLSYNFSDNNSFSINYSRRVNRPNIWFLNPVKIKDSEYSYSEGNPNLKPSYSNNFEFEHAYKDILISSIYLNSETDIFEEVNIVDPLTNITNSKPYNIGKSISYGISENINVKPLKWLKINASANVYYTKTSAKIPQLNYTLDGFSGEFTVNNTIDLNSKKTLIGNYSFNYNTKNYWTIDEIGSYVRHNIGLRALFFDKKLQLSLNVNNLLNNKSPKLTSKSNSIYSQTIYQSFADIRFGVTYNFGKTFEIEKSKTNQEEMSSQAGGK